MKKKKKIVLAPQAKILAILTGKIEECCIFFVIFSNFFEECCNQRYMVLGPMSDAWF